MEPRFSIELDRPRRAMHVTLSGFFTPEDVARYYAAVHEATAQLGGLPSRQRMLCDITGMRIQTQETVAAFSALMADPKYRYRRVAVIIASSLARMQAQRTLGDRQARIFATREEAEAWLFGPGGTAAEAA